MAQVGWINQKGVSPSIIKAVGLANHRERTIAWRSE